MIISKGNNIDAALLNTDMARILIERLGSGLQRQAIIKPSQWALKYRKMGPPFPGPWSFKYHPWLREMHDSESPYNVGQKAAQMGFTETVLNIVFFYMDVRSIDCLYILPNKTPDASDFSAARFDPAISLSSHLKRIFTEVKNVGHKRAGSANLYVRGSRSRVGLKSVPVGVIIFDEKDEMVQENLPLATERQSGYTTKVTWEVSTPTIDDFGINTTFQRSTQEHFFFPCPACSRQIELKWPESFVVTGEHEDDPRVEESKIICYECQAELNHKDKFNFLANGKFVAANPGARFRGFYVNQMYSSTVTPRELGEAYHKASVNPADEQELYNSKLGLPHIVAGARITDQDIRECISNYTSFGSYPAGNELITMGIDVGNFNHFEIDKWDSSGKPQLLFASKCRDFEELEQIFKDFRVDSAVIDAQPERRKATEFAEKFYGAVRLCLYTRGISGKSIHLGTEDDLNELKVQVDRTSWLDLSLMRFKTKSIRLPADISIEYKTHLKSLVRIYEKDSDGNPVGKYVQVNDSNNSFAGDHFAHARTYSEIAKAIHDGVYTRNISSPI